MHEGFDVKMRYGILSAKQMNATQCMWMNPTYPTPNTHKSKQTYTKNLQKKYTNAKKMLQRAQNVLNPI